VGPSAWRLRRRCAHRERICTMGMVPITATVIRPTTAMAIRRTTATETGLISATTALVTNERLPVRINEHGRETPCAPFLRAFLDLIRADFLSPVARAPPPHLARSPL